MKQVTLNLTFDTLDELAAFLANNPAAATAKVASAQPPAEVVPMPTAAPAPAPAPAVVVPTPAEEAAGQPEDDVDPIALKADLMEKVRQYADDHPDQMTAIAGLINQYGVPKLSQIPDDQLQSFETALREQFGV